MIEWDWSRRGMICSRIMLASSYIVAVRRVVSLQVGRWGQITSKLDCFSCWMKEV